MSTSAAAILCASSGVIATAFLTYSVARHAQLEISLTHPRIVVEGLLAVAFFGVAIFLWTQP